MEYKPCRITIPSRKAKNSKKESDEECKTIEDALDIDADIRQASKGKKTNAHPELVELMRMMEEDDECVNDQRLPENILRFWQVQNTFKVPFCLIVDFKSFIANGEEENHEPSGFCCLRVSAFPFMDKEEAFVYSGPNVMKAFYEHIRKEHELINEIM